MTDRDKGGGGDVPAAPGSVSLARSSALMASGTLVSRILGLLRVALLAGVLGVLDSPAGNAWQTANTLPNTVYILLAGGVLNVILVPSLTRAMAMGKERGRDFTDRLITLMLLALVAIAVVFTAGAALLTKFYALSWSGDQLALAVAFAYLCLPQVLFYGIYTLLGQILNAQEKFGWYMWAPVVNNIVAITGLLIFGALYPEAREISPAAWTGEMIWLLGGTATLGVVAQAAVLLPPVRASGFRYRPRWGFRGVGLGAASRMALWTLAVIGVSQSGMWLTTNALNRATDLQPDAAGKILYENAFLFFILPHSLITTSLITAMFTRMSRSAAAEDVTSLRRQYSHGLRLLGSVILPISVAMFLLAPAMTGVLLFRNSPEETLATAHVTMALVVGLAPYAVYILSSRIFHAFQDGRTPFRLQLAVTAVSVTGTLVAMAMPPTWTAVGIGLAQGLAQVVAAVLGVRWVRRRLGSGPLGGVRLTLARAAAGAGLAALPTMLVVWAANRLLDDPAGEHELTVGTAVGLNEVASAGAGGLLRNLTVLVVGGLVYFAVYALIAHRLGLRELTEAVEPVLRRLGRKRDPSALPTTAAGTSGLGLAAQPSPPGGGPDRKEHGLRGIEPGTALGGRYVLEDLLASRGESLEYWSAYDTTLERLVAVTVLPADGEHEEMAHAVIDGARRTAGVDDPRLVRVLDVGLEDGTCWIIEEGLAESESLASLVASRPLPAEEARRIVGEAASGMEAARRRGLHHLYLSPHAVLRTREGVIKVSGVAVAAALEQTEEIPADEASLIDTGDLVALLYTGITGRWPGEEIEGLRPAQRGTDGSLPAPAEVVAGVPGDLDALCRSMLGADYDPRNGPQTPGELARQLAPWSPEPVHGHAQIGPDSPVGEGGAAAAMGGAAGASAAATAAHVGGTPAGDETPARGTPPPDAAYYGPRQDATGGTGSTAVGSAAGYDYEDDYDDFGQEPPSGPDHTLPPGVRDEGPGGKQTGIVLLVLLGVVAVGVIIAFGAFQGLLPSTDDDPAPTVPTAAATSEGPTDTEGTTSAPEEDTETESETTSEPREEPYEFAGATGFDEFGGDEKSDLAPRAIDGDPETAWNSFTYLTPNWGNLKDGVGLALELEEEGPVSQVTIEFPRGDYGAEVFVNDEPTTEGGTSIGSDEEASGTWEITVEEPVTGQYVVIWFDRAWQEPGRGEIVYVSEVTVQ